MDIPLKLEEKQRLKEQKIFKKNLSSFSMIEIQEALHVSYDRARFLFALIQFQSIPSIGIRFAEDLVSIGLFSISDLKGKHPAHLFNTYEQERGCQVDLCVEDQFRLAVDYAEHGDHGKKWWDYTKERKLYREKYGFPKSRPKVKWNEI